MASLIILKSPLFFFFFFTLNPLLIRWFPYVGIFPNLLFHIIPFHSLPVALFIFLSPYFFFPPDPKHLHPSLSIVAFPPKELRSENLDAQARLVSAGKAPVVHLAPFTPRDVSTEGQIISDIADDMWKLSIVATLEKDLPSPVTQD